MKPMMNAETCVPTKTVSIDGTAPAAGDEVEVTLKGKVTRVEGENTYFKPETANGEPIAAGEKPADEAAENPSEDSLRARAAKEDEEGMGY